MTRRRGKGRALGLGALVVAMSTAVLAPAIPAHAGATGGTTTVVGTMRWWNGTQRSAAFGNGDNLAPAYGQVITPVSDSTLDQFVFLVKLDPSVLVRGFVYRWNAGTPALSGAPLWVGKARHTTSGTGYEKLHLDTGGLALTGGKRYVVFLSTLGIPQPDSPTAGEFAVPSVNHRDEYSGGGFVYSYSKVRSEWHTVAWGRFSWDLCFRAVLTS
ncbi:MAG: hypothetical protein JO214_14325 [Frankiaceae bacterium]|nr:hypothetical protein [Frankiaceae bacterium]